MEFEKILKKLLSKNVKDQYSAVKELSNYEIDHDIYEFLTQWIERSDVSNIVRFEIKKILKESENNNVNSKEELIYSEKQIDNEEEITFRGISKLKREIEKNNERINKGKEFYKNIIKFLLIAIFSFLIIFLSYCIFNYYYGIHSNNNSKIIFHLEKIEFLMFNNFIPIKISRKIIDKYAIALINEKKFDQLLLFCEKFNKEDNLNADIYYFYAISLIKNNGNITKIKEICEKGLKYHNNKYYSELNKILSDIELKTSF